MRAGLREIRREDGITLVETIVAAMLLAIGVIAIFGVVDAGTRNAFRAEQSQAVNEVLERELEEIKQLTYDETALTSLPTQAADPDDPHHRVVSTKYALNRDGTDQGDLVYNGSLKQNGQTYTGGTVIPGPEPFEAGDVTGDIYRYVVWRNDDSCLLVVCSGTQDFKRIVVAVRVDDAAVSYERTYQEIQGDRVNPSSDVASDLPIGGGDEELGQQFYLSDTVCNQTSRQAITGSHNVHNTLGNMGNCSEGLKTGGTRGAPDLLVADAPPPDPAPLDPANPVLYDYALDVEPNPNDDAGLQIRKNSGCNYVPSGTNAHHYVHHWLSRPMPLLFTLDGTATLELYTRAVGATSASGEVCVRIFNQPPPVCVPLLNICTPVAPTTVKSVSYPLVNWPTGGFAQIEIPMSFAPTTTLLGNRLGVSIAIRSEGTTGTDAIEIAYDHPDYASRLEIETSTLLGL